MVGLRMRPVTATSGSVSDGNLEVLMICPILPTNPPDTLGDADVGQTVRVAVSYTADNGTSESVTSE